MSPAQCSEFFVVDQGCRRLGLRARAIVFRDVKISPRGAKLNEQIVAEIRQLRERIGDAKALRSLPEVHAFQEILRGVGVNPRKEQNSVDKLLNFAWKRGDLPAINNLVDAYNLVSLRSRLSLGAHDLDRIALPVTLRLFTGSESFIPLGQHTLLPVIAGEFGYVDAANRVLCRLDVRQADFSKVTSDSRNVILIVEGTTAHSVEQFPQAFGEAIDLIASECGGRAEVVVNQGLRLPG